MIIKIKEDTDFYIYSNSLNIDHNEIYLKNSNESFFLIQASLAKRKNVFVFNERETSLDFDLINNKRVYVEKNSYVFLSPRSKFFFKNGDININDCENYLDLEMKLIKLK